MAELAAHWYSHPLARLLLRAGRVAAIVALCVWLFVMVFENSFIYFPEQYPVGEWNPPGVEFEDAYFESEDGTKLHGWYHSVPNPQAVVLFAHGNAGNLSHRWPLMKMWSERFGVSFMLFDYRGYGRSEGDPHEAGLLADARAARKWLAEREGIPEDQIVLAAESIGGAVMVDLASKDGARALIVENTFTSIPDVAAFHMPWLPVRMLLRTRFDSINKIANFHGPFLQIHGDADTIVPYEFGQRLFAAANEPKRFITIPGGDHNDPPSTTATKAIREFLKELPPVSN